MCVCVCVLYTICKFLVFSIISLSSWSFYTVIDCGDLELDNGTVISSPLQTTVGSIVMYQCSDGYVFPDGISVIDLICLENGNWSENNAICSEFYIIHVGVAK